MLLLPAILAIYETQAEKDHATALFEAHYKAMFYEARQILNSREDAEDAVQDAFIIIHDHLKRLEEINCHKTRSFVVLVAKNIARNMVRKRKRATLISFDEMPYELPSEDDDVFARIEVEAILAVIHELPELAREILLLKYRHQCTDKELADIMGIRYDAARKRIERARALLIGKLVGHD